MKLHADNARGAGAPVPSAAGRRAISTDALIAGVRAGDRAMLGRAITLVESTSAAHTAQAEEVVQRLLPFTGKSRRIGITGAPGVGKSTFIEALGCHLCGAGHRVAVLAIDPSSVRSRGSILGDKTRMEKLSGEAAAFVRPSPSGGTLGGVARRTRESLLLCEAAGFDVVLVETVGVGQSETALRSMVDFFLLLLLPGSGDDLQGIKRGIMEMADAVLINKAEGDNRRRAESMRSEQAMALHHLAPATEGWSTEVALSSGLSGQGIAEFWGLVGRFYAAQEDSGGIARRRREQAVHWLDETVRDELLGRFLRDPNVRQERASAEAAVLEGELTVAQAARRLLRAFAVNAGHLGENPVPPSPSSSSATSAS